MTDAQAPILARQAVADFKKGLLRDAAKELFSKRGIRGTSVREIAKVAGYTSSAIYTHYNSIEELYGDIVRESLETLLAKLRDVPKGELEGGRLARCVRVFYRYYIALPREFELSFHLYDGVRPHGLGKRLNSELNELMKNVFREIGKAFVADGLATAEESMTRSTEACTFVFGLLLMYHTRRLAILRENADALLDNYISLVRSSKRRRST